MIPCIIFEDEHLLVVNKPAGLNTHAPSPFAGEGIYDWLRHAEPQWAGLAIIHRLDKDTSGVMVFGKTPLANRSLTEQFAKRAVRKKYFLLTDHPLKQRELVVKSKLVRAGEKYVSRPRGEPAETRFGVPASAGAVATGRLKAELQTIHAEPVTGRTHQIRAHAAENGFPVLGDTLYGGTPFPRVCLHAAELTLHHPDSGAEISFRAPVDFTADSRLELRAALLDQKETNAFRIIQGAADGWAGWTVEKLGDFMLAQSEANWSEARRQDLERLMRHFAIRGVYHKPLRRQVRCAAPAEASPWLVLGEAAPARFGICENGLRFELSLEEGYSSGLFLDQRDNRRRLLTGHVAAGFSLFDPGGEAHGSKPELLNTFAYTCGFSVCAARAGARTTSLDLSKKYLAWGQRNFELNHLDPGAHEFLAGEVFDWLRRLAKKGRRFDAVLLDPPTFSQAKSRGVFRAEKNYAQLVQAALPLVGPRGILFASTNAAGWPPEEFLGTVESAIRAGRRKIIQRHYFPQPPDFPISRTEPAYLKTFWLRVE